MVGGGGGRLACGSRRCARLAAFWLPAAARGGATGRRLVGCRRRPSADCRQRGSLPRKEQLLQPSAPPKAESPPTAAAADHRRQRR